MLARIIVSQSVIVALSALHPHIHPCLRPPWNERLRTQTAASHALNDKETRVRLVKTALPTKEAVRRLLSVTMKDSLATFNALARLEHPLGTLTSPPTAMPARGMEAAMIAFARAGVQLRAPEDYISVITSSFECGGGDFSWDSGWLGKGNASVPTKTPLSVLASDIWSTAFRTNFLVYWSHCAANKIRCTRLDYVQHRAIHSLNAATNLVNQLSEREQLEVQRLALSCPSSGILTLDECASLLGVHYSCDINGGGSNGGPKSTADNIALLESAGGRGAAKILAFSRAAWVHEEVLTVWLGTQTAGMQVQALFLRLQVPGADELFARDPCEISVNDYIKSGSLPIASTHLHVCLECR
jgi:hypothetical protein